MKQEDILYISENLSQLLGIPVRVYKKKELLSFFSLVTLVKDPFELSKYILDYNKGNLFYYYSNESFYYCVLKSEDYQIVVGPFRYFVNDKQVFYNLAFKLDIEKEHIQRFVSSMQSISLMPLETVIHSLCSYNYILNHEKLSIESITISAEAQEEIKRDQQNENVVSSNEAVQTRNSTMDIEETLQKFVEEGNIDGFNDWIKSAPSVQSGALSTDYIRHQKNTFIVSCTLFSRAAIRGGLDYNDALNLSDDYIRKCESCNTYNEITNLSYAMLKDYIQRVHKIQSKESPLKTRVSCYVLNHISDCISLDDISNYLHMSKSYLCLRFKNETGETVTDFVLQKKIAEAEMLLQDTSKTISSIALFLGFSSQAHFTKVFTKYNGESPQKFRNHWNKKKPLTV